MTHTLKKPRSSHTDGNGDNGLATEDGRQAYCRRLGHRIAFRYCRTQEGATMCPLILDCWWQQFDVNAFLRRHLTPEEFARLGQATPKPKLTSILELIEQARREPGE